MFYLSNGIVRVATLLKDHTMRIAIDARIINTGTGRYIERLLHYLEDLDTANDYLILVRRADIDYYQPQNPRFTVVEADFGDYSFSEQFGLNRLLRQLKPDLVHFCMPQQPLLYTKPAITTVHDLNLLRITANDDMNWLELRIKRVVFATLLWIVAHRTKHIIAPSNYTKQDLLRFSGVPPGKITVTYEGGATPFKTREPMPIYQNVPFIMYVGRAEPYKNNRGLILAHQQLLAKHPKLRLLIVGPTDILRKADMAWVQKQDYRQVEFTGFISNAQQAWLYANCQAYVQPTLMEGFGLPGLEAMANGAAVLSSNTTCLPEIYGDAAHYFDPRQPADIARAIDDVLSNPALRQKLIAKSAKQAQQYSWQRMAEQTLTIYEHTGASAS